MKKITLFSILAAFVAALSFTSCNTDSDNGYSPLSKDAQNNFQMAMSVGSYNDMVVLFEKKNDANVNNQTDSVASSVRISMTGDSTMSISNFPIAAIAEHISNKELSQAIVIYDVHTHYVAIAETVVVDAGHGNLVDVAR